MIKITSLHTEYLENPLGIDSKVPRLGWKFISDKKNVMQKAFQIQVSKNEAFSKLVWDSGKVESDNSQRISYGGLKLKSMERIYWRVKVWTNKEESDFSKPAFFEMGLLHTSDWKAKWIEPESDIDADKYKPASYIRKEFMVKNGLVSARAYMTAKGLYSFYINESEGTDKLFTPGFTSYYKRLQYQAYDITNLLNKGNNVFGIILGDGWWRGSSGPSSIRNNFGYKLGFLGQIVLTYNDGTKEIVGSDASFKTAYGPIQKSDMKSGETYDARINIDGWNKPCYDDSKWKNVNVAQDRFENLIATRSVPVRRKETFTPKILKTQNGETVLDFGQNIFGSVNMKVQGKAGTEVVLIHGEALDKDGNFTLKNLGFAGKVKDFQEVHYILSGKGIESYTPRFAIFGFRYVLVKNYPGEIKAENFIASAIYSDMEETGYFSCSNPMLNKLVSNSKWSQKSNFMDIPTDCPTRERAGWTGDAQVYCRTASDFMNVYTFFEKWMSDVEAEQFSNGSVGSTVPNVLGFHNSVEAERISKMVEDPFTKMLTAGTPEEGGILDGSAGWGDAAVIIPWTLYLCYGDKNILKKQYTSAKAWVDYMDACAKNSNENYKDTPAYHNYTDGELDANYIWDTKFHWGEWLEADTNIGEAGADMGKMLSKMIEFSDPLVATAYYAYSTHLFSQIAAIIGKKEDEEKYGKLFEKIKKIYNKYFIKEDGYILNDRQAPNVRTLAFDLAYENKKQAVTNRLVKIIKEKDYHLNTGFLSTPFLLHVLADNGYPDVAFKLLEQDTFPSWLYAVTRGATTIWEKWAGITPEGELSGSLNHYSYGAVCDFLFAVVAGIRPTIKNPGYKHFVIKPLQGGSLTCASAEYESLYGTIKSSWKKQDDKVCYDFEIPANTTATILLPGDVKDLKLLIKEFNDACFENGRIKFEVGSGIYNVTI